MQLISPDTHIDFLNKRKIAFAVSGILLLVSLGFLVTKGLNFGIDFTGGTLVEARFQKPPEISKIRKTLSPAGYGSAIIQEFGSPEEIMIRVQNANAKNSSAISNSILSALKQGFGADGVQMRRVEFVGPQVGEELTRAGIMAVLISMLAILLYVTFRFEFRFALGADAALLHDITLVIGAFSITGKEFSLPVVAAILTVIGYSLNDTIVVFDRIRENLASNRKKKNPLTEFGVVNSSINETLSRTLMTSITTLIVVIALFLLGGEVIHSFAFALIVGIVVGTYSSVYIASPVMLSLHSQSKTRQEDIAKMKARP